METFTKHPESIVTIRFSDCDPFGHLNNARYIDYFLNAREDHLLNHYDFKLFYLAQQEGKGWVVGQNQISYLKPANLMEKVRIRTSLRDFSPHTLLVEMLMFDSQQTHLKSILWTRFVHFDLQKKRKTEHAAALLQLFASVTIPLPAEMSYEERVTQLRSQNWHPQQVNP